MALNKICELNDFEVSLTTKRFFFVICLLGVVCHHTIFTFFDTLALKMEICGDRYLKLYLIATTALHKSQTKRCIFCPKDYANDLGLVVNMCRQIKSIWWVQWIEK